MIGDGLMVMPRVFANRRGIGGGVKVYENPIS